MFNKLSKNQKIIVYFCIGISFLFVIPLILWSGVFIGYQICKNEMKVGIETVLDNTNEKIDKNFMEIDF